MTQGSTAVGVGGNVATAYGEIIIRRMVERGFAAARLHQAIRRLLREPFWMLVFSSAAPGIGGTLAGFIKDEWFPWPKVGAYARQIVSEIFNEASRVARDNGGEPLTPEQFQSAVDRVTDPSRDIYLQGLIFHTRLDCPQLVRLGVKPADMTKTTLESVLSQRVYGACTMCGDTSAPSRLERSVVRKYWRSFGEVLGDNDIPEDVRAEFNQWIQTVTSKEDRAKLTATLHEINSVDEFVGLMSFPAEIRFDMWELFVDGNTQTFMRQLVSKLGEYAKGGYAFFAKALQQGWTKIKDFDASLDKTVAGMQRLVDETKGPKGFWAKLGEGVSALFNPFE